MEKAASKIFTGSGVQVNPVAVYLYLEVLLLSLRVLDLFTSWLEWSLWQRLLGRGVFFSSFFFFRL